MIRNVDRKMPKSLLGVLFFRTDLRDYRAALSMLRDDNAVGLNLSKSRDCEHPMALLERKS